MKSVLDNGLLNCIVLLIYFYVDIIQYKAMHKFVGVWDKPQEFGGLEWRARTCLLQQDVT